MDQWSLKFNQFILEEIVKAGNDRPVVFEVTSLTWKVIIPSYRVIGVCLWLYNNRFPVYPALFSCEEIVKAGNDGQVVFKVQPVYPALFSCEEIVKASNDGPVVFEVSFKGHYTELYWDLRASFYPACTFFGFTRY
ncbi:4663_t:CDS:2 [Funneliformis geosporum]|uniref:4663_t:CDS:1 n=1 Tax=Funneliformis geosporum TaxID=1117311 RepID=A0A9W4SG90_9GLOM|nr:4663_t:CDS:2 [Funneliformis geosporum]